MLVRVRTDAVLDVVGELHHADGLDAFRRTALEALPRAVPADYVSYNELGWDGEALVALARPELPAWAHDAWTRWSHQNPLLRRYATTRDGRPYRFSDVLAPGELERLELHRELYGPLGIDHQLAVMLPAPADRIIAVVLSGARAFTEDDRRTADLLRPHLIQAFRNAALRDELRGVVAALDAGLEVGGDAVVVAGADGRVRLATSAAGDLLALTAVGRLEPGDELPAALRDPGVARVVLPAGERGPVVARRVPAADGRSVALLVEHGSRGASLELLEQLGLTRREAEVLRALMRGLPTAEVARAMGISPRTVHKHAERIFGKLGVRDRVGAVAAAWAAIDVRGPGLPAVGSG
jgi:DNA-binding CsgD family transcriptional regulator